MVYFNQHEGVFILNYFFGGIMKKNSEKKVVEKKSTSKKTKLYIAEKKTNKNKKEKKGNVFKNVAGYFKGVGKEIKRIRWTDKGSLLKYSICTLIFVLFFGLYFYAIDWLALLIRSLA